MPSSLVFAALVLAWLAVLVPVIARRRQMVPRPAEADLSARVLPRAVGAPANEELPVTMTSRVHDDRGGRSAAGGSATAVIERDRRVLDAELDDELDLDSYDGEDEPERPGAGDRDRRRHADERHDRYEADDEYGAGYDDEYDGGYDDGYDVDDTDERFDDAHLDDDVELDDDREPATPRSYRPGRGGFDPDAAAEAAQHRYAFRQRVALGLIAVAVLSALAALVVTAALWWLHLAVDLVLVGYLVFLRRQTRLEEDLRIRRAARLSGERRAIEARRERQAEHDARMAAVRRESADWRQGDPAAADVEDDLDGYEEYDGYDDEDLDDAAPRWAAPRTPAPPVPEGMELVDDSPDDPDFHRLDGRESVPSYRRAAGA